MNVTVSDVYTWQKPELIRRCIEFRLDSEGTVRELRERVMGYVRRYASVNMETKVKSVGKSIEEVSVPNLAFSLDFKKIDREIERHDIQIQYLRAQIKEDSILVNTLHLQEVLNAGLKLGLNYIRTQLGQEGGVEQRTVERLLQERDLWELQAQERWILCRYWADRMQNVLLEKLCTQVKMA